MIKVKASEVLTEALARIIDKRQAFACAAIQDVETDIRFAKKDEVKSNAMKIFAKFKPPQVREDMKTYGEWWPKGDERRIEALKMAIETAKKAND